jgi:hypothetical protein
MQVVARIHACEDLIAQTTPMVSRAAAALEENVKSPPGMATERGEVQ